MFYVLVAADIFGAKTNFELSFAQRPTLQELVRTTEVAFTAEIALRRPDGVPPHAFHVSKVKLYDEDRGKWVDLQADAQLQDLCQTYAFQHENPWHRESQKEIPPAVRPPPPLANAGPLRPASSFMPGAGGGGTPSQQGLGPRGATPVARTLSGAGYGSTGSGAPMSQPPSRGFGNVDADQAEKVRVVFNEFDTKGQRMIDLEDLKQGFRTLGLDFTTATMNDLFQKGDSNHDGRITFGEFERFAKFYPIMTDCLYYRSKAFWDDEAMHRQLQSEKDAVRQAGQVVASAEAQLADARKAAEEAANAIAMHDGDVKTRSSRTRDLATQSEQLQRDKERAAKEKYDREGDFVAVRDRERTSRVTHQDVVRELDKADRKAALLGSDAQKADERVKQLQAQLADAQRAAERANQAVRAAAGDVDTLRTREREAAKQAETASRELPRFEEAARAAESAHTAITERLREVEQLHRENQREIDEAARRRDAAERAAQAARDLEQRATDDVENARRAAAERERLAREREAELLEQQRQRQLVTAQERALIEQELRLREQRESLEEKEVRLKTEASSFLSNLRTTLSRPPSTSYARAESFR